MRVSEVRLGNFRNYQDLALELTAGPTLFFGENGQGKTNLVEAIAYLSSFESHRVSGYQAIIREGQPSAQLGATAVSDKRNLKIAIELNSQTANRYWLNGSLRKRAADLAGVVSAVTFAPEDIDIIRRDPSDRRRFLDQLSTQLQPKIAAVFADYERVVKQRNTLLKTARSNSELGTLEIWDEQLVLLGIQIMRGRQSLIRDLEPVMRTFYSELLGTDANLTLKLESSVFETRDWTALDAQAQQEVFHEKLSGLRARELERGVTLVGPHRDELLVELDGRSSREHASQGEAWSLALGAKLGSATLIRQFSETGDPILILDDVFAVLDPKRRERLAKFVSSSEQVLITATTPGDLPGMNWAAQHRVANGTLV